MTSRFGFTTRDRIVGSSAALVLALSLVSVAAHDHDAHDHGVPAAAPATPLADDRHDHDHSNPATLNSLSRATGDTESSEQADPTTPEEAAIAALAVGRQRTQVEPTLLPSPEPPPRREVPEDQYAMAGGCYVIQSVVTDGYVVPAASGWSATGTAQTATPFHFQATDLERNLLWSNDRRFIAADSTDAVGALVDDLVGTDRTLARSASAPSRHADWRIVPASDGFNISLPATGQILTTRSDGSMALGPESPGKRADYRFRLAEGCADWPDVEINVTGQPHMGETRQAEVRGYVDAHTHGTAYEFLGGEVHCGRPWHRFGVAHALVDCPDHQIANGSAAVLENFLSGDVPVGTHDPVGWPTFRDWPAPGSLTHEGTYHRWMERAYRGGLRLFVNLLVENNQLCNVYPLKHNSCDDMDSVRLQAQRMVELERYIDAQAGGPGEGWYRIVTDPFEARDIINQGKMAVVMGIETSVVFGCSLRSGEPTCTEESIERQLDEVYDLGVRQMELVNKFDNGLSGVAGDGGTTGVVVNAGNFLETGSFWAMRNCSENPEGVTDNPQLTAPGEISNRDMLFGAIAEEYLPPGLLPVYAEGPHCNRRGLSDLGAFTIESMVERGMLFDPDHMSVLARQQSLDLLEELGYAGVVSSHSWSTPDAYPRIYELGGMITPYAGDSEGFVSKWERHLGWSDDRYYFGFGYGADINGLGAQGGPRGANVDDPVTYPFRGLGGVVVDQQVSGKRVYDINVDGVAHYGLYPDWIEDLRQIAGDDIVRDMERGAEAYLQTWERAVGVANDACRQPDLRLTTRAFRDLPVGATVEEVLMAVGQPHTRLGDTFRYCALPAGKVVRDVLVHFDDDERMTHVSLTKPA